MDTNFIKKLSTEYEFLLIELAIISSVVLNN